MADMSTSLMRILPFLFVFTGCDFIEKMNPSETDKPSSKIAVETAQTISVVAKSTGHFSQALVTDILFDHIDEGYRFTRAALFGDSFTLSVFRSDGKYYKTILYGFPDYSFDDGTGQSSSFGEEEITQEEFEVVVSEFRKYNLCNKKSDFYDIAEIGDGAIISYEALVDGQYCAAWSIQRGAKDFEGIGQTMFESFDLNPDLGPGVTR